MKFTFFQFNFSEIKRCQCGNQVILGGLAPSAEKRIVTNGNDSLGIMQEQM